MKTINRILGIFALLTIFTIGAFAATEHSNLPVTFTPFATMHVNGAPVTLYMSDKGSVMVQPQAKPFALFAPADTTAPQTFGYSVIVDVTQRPYQVIPVLTYSLGVQHQLFGIKWLNPTFNLLGGINASEANAGTLGGSLDQGFMLSKEATLRLGVFARGQTGTDNKIRFGPTVSISGHFGG